jgi:hypothetical protein
MVSRHSFPSYSISLTLIINPTYGRMTGRTSSCSGSASAIFYSRDWCTAIVFKICKLPFSSCSHVIVIVVVGNRRLIAHLVATCITNELTL